MNLLQAFGSICRALIYVEPAVDERGYTALYRAVRNEKADKVRALILEGADVNFGTKKGVTPLQRAAAKGRIKVLHSLLEAGADIDQADRKGRTALRRATETGQVKAMRILIRAGADVDLEDDNLISLASLKGHAKAVRLLINEGAPIPSQNELIDLWLRAKHKRFCKLAKLLFEQLENKEQAKLILAHVDLGHRFHLHKKVKVSGGPDGSQRKVGLEGAWAPRFLQQIYGSFGKWKCKKSTLNDGDFEQIREVFKHASRPHPSSKELLKLYHQGLPVLISTGPSKHEVQLILYGELMVECNRINGDQPALRFHFINSDSVSQSLLKQVLKGTQKSSEFDNLLEMLRRKLGAQRLRHFDYVEQLIPFCRQVVGNCTWTTSIASLFCLVLLKSLEKRGESLIFLFEEGEREQIRACIRRAWKDVTKWQQHEMSRALKRFIMRWSGTELSPSPDFVERLFQRMWSVKQPGKSFRRKVEKIETLYTAGLATETSRDRFQMLRLCGPWVGVTPKRIML